MKKTFITFLTIFVSVLLFSSCKNEDEKWEYKSISVSGLGYSDFFSKQFIYADNSLNALGKEGWELVGTYTINETVHPNFGNKEYVTGLQPNTRTSEVVFVLKRKLRESKQKPTK